MAARAYAIRRARTTKAQEPREEENSPLGRVTTANNPPTSQDQSTEMSAYHQFLVHKNAQKTEPSRTHDITPSPSVAAVPTALQNGAYMNTIPTATPNPASQQAQWSMSLPVSRTNSTPSALPSQTFGATISDPQWDAGDLPEMPAESTAEDPVSSEAMSDSPPEPPLGYSPATTEFQMLSLPKSLDNDNVPFSMTKQSGSQEIADVSGQTEDSSTPRVDSQTFHSQIMDTMPASSKQAEASASTGYLNRVWDVQAQSQTGVRLPEIRSQSAGGTCHNINNTTDNASLQTTEGATYSVPIKRGTKHPRSTSQPSSVDARSIHHPQNQHLSQYAPGNTSRVSLVSALTADTPPSSRDPSMFGKESSIWSADTAFSTATTSTASTSISQLREKPLPISLPPSSSFLSDSPMSGPSIRRKPVGDSMRAYGSLPDPKKAPLHQHSIDEDSAVSSNCEALTQSPSQIQGAGLSNQGPTRYLSYTPGHPDQIHYHRKPATSVSLPAVPTIELSEFNIDRPDQDGFPLLVRAARDGVGEMVEKLLTSGANIEALHTITKRNALIEASLKGHSQIVEFLLDHRCSTQHLDSDQMSALHHAAQKGYLLVAKALLDRGAGVDTQGLDGLTPLYLASWMPHANMVMLLLQRHANVNGRDAYQRSALHVAASRGFTNVCSLLLEHGAQPESRDGSSKTPLQLAVAAEHIEVVENLLERSNIRPTDINFTSAFFGAIEVGNVKLAEAFLRRGAIFKGLKSDSYKPITLAAKSGNPGMVDLIIRVQGKVSKEKDSNGWTALHYAAHYGHTPIVERLADKEISTSKITSKKETPLHLAVKAQQFGVAEFLLRTKASETILSKDAQGQQPLHHAARGGDGNIVNLLFSHQAKFDVENGFGWKPLHIAVAYGHLEVAEHLLGHGASIEERLGTTDYKQKDTHSYVEAGY